MFGLFVHPAGGEQLVLEAAKDTFGRSNSRTRNSGGSEHLLVANAPSVRSLMAFDLSGVTNTVVAAKLQFRQHSSAPAAVALVIAPMVNTRNNAAWGEGIGALGAKGQNARIGEACYARSAFRDVKWESATHAALQDLGDPTLWKAPVGKPMRLKWVVGQWVDVKVPVELVEAVRNSDLQMLSFGLWGTAGNGLYYISSKESGHAPKLVLTLEEVEGGKR